MKYLREIKKLLRIYLFLLEISFKSIFTSNLIYRKYLTSIFLLAIQRKSKIPTITLNPKINYDIVISNEVLIDENLKMENRFVYQTHHELINLLTLLKLSNAKNIFEFGLMQGGSLYHFHKNSNAESWLYSLDITFDNLPKKMHDYIELNRNIQIISGNSREFDFSPYSQKIDFIFIDGGHDYETVYSDSKNALKMRSNESIIVWDDYNIEYPDVFKVVNQLFLEGHNIKHIKDTSLAILANRIF